MKKRRLRSAFLCLLAIILIGFLIPQSFQMPVSGAGKKSYDQRSFWFYPWGKSVTHKGVDIFSPEGTKIKPASPGLVVYAGQLSRGGNVILVLSAKWRLHYYAHLKEIKTSRFSLVGSDDTIGLVGTTGNAKGKPPHLHYALKTIFPYPWRIDNSKQGWKKMFFLNPIEFLNKG